MIDVHFPLYRTDATQHQHDTAHTRCLSRALFGVLAFACDTTRDRRHLRRHDAPRLHTLQRHIETKEGIKFGWTSGTNQAHAEVSRAAAKSSTTR